MKPIQTALAGLAFAASAVAAEPEPGKTMRIDPSQLPPLGASQSVSRGPIVVTRPNQTTLAVPKGYRATLFAERLEDARNLLALPDGGVILAQSALGQLVLLKDTKGSGHADVVRQIAGDFDNPFGLAFHDGAIWVGDLDGVWRLPWNGTSAGDRVRITAKGALGSKGGHATRSLAIAPDGRRFFVGIGSVGNLDVEPIPRATIQVFTMEGKDQRTFASGLRNAVGIAFRPGTDELWAVVNERDGQGDEMVPDYLVHVRENAFYGWPYAYLGPNPQSPFSAKAPDKVAATKAPDLLFHAHSAPLGLAFWRSDAFVALHGSWNSAQPQGYFVARVPFADGKPTGDYQVFASGFLIGEKGGRARVWGRPVGLAVGADDALYVCDDAGGTVWRITREAD